MATKNLYHIITFSHDSGEDEKPETRTFSDAIKSAKAYLATGYYYEVKIYHHHELKRHYMRLRNGKIENLPTNTPQTAETPQISMIGAKVEDLPTNRKTTPQGQNKCRVSSVLATAHELYDAAFIGDPERIY